MIKLLSLRDKQILNVLSRFKDFPILSRGTSSIVLDCLDDTVIKLTVDDHGYAWLAAPNYGVDKLAEDSPYKLDVVEDLGDVSDIDLYLGPRGTLHQCTLHGVRMKKYSRLYQSSMTEEEVGRTRYLKQTFRKARGIKYTPDTANYFHSQAEAWLEKHPDDEHFSELLQAVYYMCADYHARPDVLSTGNLLGHNGVPMLVDPVFDPTLISAIYGIDPKQYQQP